jgi:hypothetical protein
MLVTVIILEYIFVKAMCELQMAVNDLHALSLKQQEFGLEVQYDRACQLL